MCECVCGVCVDVGVGAVVGVVVGVGVGVDVYSVKLMLGILIKALPIFVKIMSSHTQHRPICVHVEHMIVAQAATFRRRFNPRKADWD